MKGDRLTESVASSIGENTVTSRNDSDHVGESEDRVTVSITSSCGFTDRETFTVRSGTAKTFARNLMKMSLRAYERSATEAE